MLARCCCLLTLWTGGAAATMQDDSAADEAARIERELKVARTGRPQVRPQAARRLVSMGAPVVERLLAECRDGDGMAALGKDLVEVLGEFGDARLRERLWSAVADRDFPWRPAAARSLGKSAMAGEVEAFDALIQDPIAAVRAAGLNGYETLDRRDRGERVEARLRDQDDKVRRAAATLLDSWGQGWALAWLLEDLRRVDAYFGRPHGRSARYAALKVLEARLGDRYGFDPRAEPGEDANLAALARLREKIAERAGGTLRELPDIARAGPRIEGERLGLEVRSCRRGEFVLRWCEGDRLYVGAGNPAEVALAEGTTARLMALVEPLMEQLGRGRFWGQPGCDLENYHVQVEGARRAVTLSLSKGPEAIEGLRPRVLSELARELIASLPETGDDPRLVGLREAVAEALEAVGGGVRP